MSAMLKGRLFAARKSPVLTNTKEGWHETSCRGMSDTGWLLESISETHTFHLVALILLTILVRLQIFFHLDEVIVGWRPTDNASIALNYLRNGFHLLYPQIYWGGNGPGYVEMEFPIVQYSTALLYKLFGVHDAVALIIPLSSVVGLVIVMYSLARTLFGVPAALITAILVAVSPVLSRDSQRLNVDPTMIFFSALGVYAFIRWISEKKLLFFLMSGTAVSLAILLKPTAALLGIPLLYLFWTTNGRRFLWQRRTWQFAAMTLLPAILWYYHAYRLSQEYHNTFGILFNGMTKLSTARLLLDPAFYKAVIEKILVYQITPFASLFFLYACFIRGEKRLGYVVHVWLFAVLIYILVAGEGAKWGQQYLLPILLPGSLMAAVGFIRLLPRLESYFRPVLSRRMLWIMLGIVFISTVIPASLLLQRRDFFSVLGNAERRSGLRLGKVMEPGSLIIVVNSMMDSVTPDKSMTTPDVFYFTQHRGWYVSSAWLTEHLVEQLKSQGAHYLVVSGFFVSDFEARQSALFKWLRSRYKIVVDSNEGLVVNLCS
jgi:hypothetical protein